MHVSRVGKFIIVLVALLSAQSAISNVDIYSHRGAAGLAPENTLPGFKTALIIGVNAVDLDVVLTKDDIVVLAHDFRLNPEFTRIQSTWIKADPAIATLTLKALQQYDVGRADPNGYYYQAHPYQTPRDHTKIPTLTQVVRYINAHATTPIRFQIELKTTPLKDPSSPDRQRLIKAVLAVLRQEKIVERTEIQSFDWQTLLTLKEQEPSITLSFITVENRVFNNIKAGDYGDTSWTAGYHIKKFNNSLPKMIATLGGGVWNPYYKDIDQKKVREAQALGLRVVPWLVDNERDMTRMLDIGVDGIITNRPDILRGVMAAHGHPLPMPSRVTS